MLLHSHKFLVKFVSGSKRCCVCFFWRIKNAKVSICSSISYLCEPLIGRFTPRYPFESRFVTGSKFHISKVLLSSRQSQIVPSVVISYTINMINISRRPNVCHQRPDNSMRRVIQFSYLYTNITVFIERSCYFVNTSVSKYGVSSFFPYQISCFWLVGKSIFKVFYRKLFHEVAPC